MAEGQGDSISYQVFWLRFAVLTSAQQQLLTTITPLECSYLAIIPFEWQQNSCSASANTRSDQKSLGQRSNARLATLNAADCGTKWMNWVCYAIQCKKFVDTLYGCRFMVIRVNVAENCLYKQCRTFWKCKEVPLNALNSVIREKKHLRYYSKRIGDACVSKSTCNSSYKMPEDGRENVKLKERGGAVLWPLQLLT